MTGLELDFSVWQAVVWVGMGTSVWFCLMSLYGGWHFFARRRREDELSADWAPAVTILKPLNGLEPELYENLSTFCRQTYPDFQIIFGVADADDPAVAVVQDLQRRHPRVDIDLVIDDRIHGANYKISNLINMYPSAKHDVIVLSDSDIRVSADYLRRVVAPLRCEQVGLVTCLYRAVSANGLATNLWCLSINATFFPQILVARQVEQPTYAFGASIALRRSTLEAVGGFQQLANVLADDYHLGHQIASRGLTLWLSDYVVETVLDVGSANGLFQHQMRRARTNRNCRPASYFATVLTHGVLWAILNLLASGLGLVAVCASLVTVGTRLITAARFSRRYLGSKLGALGLLQVLLTDVLLSLVWGLSYFGSGVWWSGRRFQVLKSGEIKLRGVRPGVAAADAAVKEAS